jgi:hypothetical protein
MVEKLEGVTTGSIVGAALDGGVPAEISLNGRRPAAEIIDITFENRASFVGNGNGRAGGIDEGIEPFFQPIRSRAIGFVGIIVTILKYEVARRAPNVLGFQGASVEGTFLDDLIAAIEGDASGGGGVGGGVLASAKYLLGDTTAEGIVAEDVLFTIGEDPDHSIPRIVNQADRRVGASDGISVIESNVGHSAVFGVLVVGLRLRAIYATSEEIAEGIGREDSRRFRRVQDRP